MPEYVIGRAPSKKKKPTQNVRVNFSINKSRDVCFNWYLQGEITGKDGVSHRIYRTGHADEKEFPLHPDRYKFDVETSTSEEAISAFQLNVEKLLILKSAKEWIMMFVFPILEEALEARKALDSEKFFMGSRLKADERIDIKGADIRTYIPKYRYINQTKNNSIPAFYMFSTFRQPGDKLVEVKQDGPNWTDDCHLFLLLNPGEYEQFKHEVVLATRLKVSKMLDE